MEATALPTEPPPLPSAHVFLLLNLLINNSTKLGGSPGLVVMGDDSYTKSCGFEFHCYILNGHFVTLICFKNCMVCLKIPKINGKEAGVGTF